MFAFHPARRGFTPYQLYTKSIFGLYLAGILFQITMDVNLKKRLNYGIAVSVLKNADSVSVLARANVRTYPESWVII
jgi:hypothetical protein